MMGDLNQSQFFSDWAFLTGCSPAGKVAMKLINQKEKLKNNPDNELHAHPRSLSAHSVTFEFTFRCLSSIVGLCRGPRGLGRGETLSLQTAAQSWGALQERASGRLEPSGGRSYSNADSFTGSVRVYVTLLLGWI